MKITVTHNTEEVTRAVALFFSDQLPFVEASAINDTAKQAQVVQRAHQRKVFDAKRLPWMDRAVKIKPFADKRQSPIEAKISIDPPRGRDGGSRASILTQHEADRAKTPVSGTHIAVPTKHVPRTASGVIRSGWRPGRLKKRNFQGGFRTFVRDTSKGRAIFFDETGSGGGIVPLYWLVRSVPLDQRLDFVPNIIKAVQANYATNFTKRFDRAIGLRGFGR